MNCRLLSLALLAVAALLTFCRPAPAELLELEGLRREPFAGGKPFGDCGPTSASSPSPAPPP